MPKQVIPTAVLYPLPVLTGSMQGGSLVLSWTPAQCSLTWATNVNGPYVDVPGTPPTPYPLPNLSGPQLFFRVRY